MYEKKNTSQSLLLINPIVLQFYRALICAHIDYINWLLNLKLEYYVLLAAPPADCRAVDTLGEMWFCKQKKQRLQFLDLPDDKNWFNTCFFFLSLSILLLTLKFMSYFVVLLKLLLVMVEGCSLALFKFNYFLAKKRLVLLVSGFERGYRRSIPFPPTILKYGKHLRRL